MYRVSRNDDSDEIVTLLKETADGFGRLMADHVKLARLELFADVKTLGRRVATLAVVVSFASLGYTFCCLGLAVTMSRWMGLGGALLLLGGAHLVGGTIALLFAMRRLRGMHLMHETACEMSESVSTLSTRFLNGAVPAAAAPERTAAGARTITARAEGGLPIAEP